MLIISGLDPSAGAGLLQDIKISSVMGIRAYGIVSAFTTQNEQRVFAVNFRKWEDIRKELEVLPAPRVIKVGLALPEVVKSLRELFPGSTIIWNVILESSSGFKFLDSEEVKKFVNYADYVVLNNEESEKIGKKEHFIITGGHENNSQIKVIYKDKTFETSRVRGEFHGTGCAFSTAVAGFLDLGYPIEESIRSSMKLVRKILEKSHEIVETEKVAREWHRYDVLSTLDEILPFYLEIGHLTVPEVGQNVSFALPWAKDEFEVGKFPGRLRLKSGTAVSVSAASFNDKSHTSRMTVTMMKFFPHIRCTVNVRFKKEYIDRAKKKGLKIYHHDRSKEPEEIQKNEGKSMVWMIEQAISKLKSPPDIIYDEGWWGKEAMIRVFGRDPEETLEKIKLMLEE